MAEKNLIFRLGSSAAETYQDWQNVGEFPYDKARIETIKDPEGSTDRKEITSIPSPFARIDLVKTAFQEVVKDSQGLNGNTIFHKMVSDALDVGQIFFDLDKYQDMIEVVSWNPKRDLETLKTSRNKGHRYFADALDKYLKSDANSYNFSNLQSIYLLRYCDGPQEMTIIGATSPSTLFFSNANDLSFIKKITFGRDKPFDKVYKPLYERDNEYIKYLWYLKKSIDGFSETFHELDIYLSKTYEAVVNNSELRKALDEISENPMSYGGQLKKISVTNNDHNDTVEVLGHALYQRGEQDIENISDFLVQASKDNAIKPLILPVDKGNKYSALTYTSDKWGNENHVEYYDPEQSLLKRKLPCDSATYPYLTISDFLEERLIRVPHALNSKGYFDGHCWPNDEAYSYLLPVRPLFFEYFTVNDLCGKVKDGKYMFEMTELTGGEKVTLRIPIRGAGDISYIEYNRIYYNDRRISPEEVRKSNEGSINEIKFTGFVMPHVSFNNPNDAIYNVTSIKSSSEDITFTFLEDGKVVPYKSKTSRKKNIDLAIIGENYFLEGSNFELIQVKKYDSTGLLVPLFSPQRDGDVFEFAIDLGTSNTHIEYCADSDEAVPFQVESNEQLICPMFIPTQSESRQKRDLMEEEIELMVKDYLPEEISHKTDFVFPTRTVLSYAKDVNWRSIIDPFTLINIPLTYNKLSPQKGNKYQCDIKWGGEGEDVIRMTKYVECLMLMIRDKVLVNSGNLALTKIVWTYPLSMPPKRLRELNETWNNAYKRYFNANGVTTSLSESEAPIIYYFSRCASASNMVNIDIGGGTTDIAFAENDQVQSVSSVRFAANNLFMDAYAPQNRSNGIIDFYKEKIKAVLVEKVPELIYAYNEENNRLPANMAAFLFSLKDSKKLITEGVEVSSVDFNTMLARDEDFKIVFILFYAAIIYYIALAIQSKSIGGEIELPRHIILSGNGSKIVRAITTDQKLLAAFTKEILSEVLGVPYDIELEIIGLDDETEPKAATCKGSLIRSKNEKTDTPEILVTNTGQRRLGDEDTYQKISDEYMKECLDVVCVFFDFILERLNKDFNLDRNFGVTKSSIKIAREEVAKRGDLKTFLERGVNGRIEEGDISDSIEESFFFYPIKGVLHTISDRINKEIK